MEKFCGVQIMSNYDPRFQDILMGRPRPSNRLSIKDQEQADADAAVLKERRQKRLTAIQKKQAAAILEEVQAAQRMQPPPKRKNGFIRFLLALESLNDSLPRVDPGMVLIKAVVFGPIFVLGLVWVWPILLWFFGIFFAVLVAAIIYDWRHKK